MADKDRIPTKFVPKVFKKIGGEIEPHTDPALGAYLVTLVKDREEMARFRDSPEQALKTAGIDPARVNPQIIGRVAEAIVTRWQTLLPDNPAADTLSTKELSSSQERNFDNSSSWYQNKDGYNVIYDAGHSSEKTTGEMVGQDKKFNGIEIGDFEEVIRDELRAVFFPAQPLVTPQLVDMVKAAAKEVKR